MSKRCYGCMKLKEKSPVCEHCGYNENVPNEAHQIPIGTVLQGRYQVGKKLGQGGFGITYIGWDMSLETAVAIKEYYPGSLVNRDCGQTLNVSCNGSNLAELFALNRDRFLREARILAKLSRVPGIVRVQNLFAENNTAYIVMEYVEGIDLKRYIQMQGRTLTVEEVFAVMQPVMYALSKVHDAELVHRDISPDNIMIQKDGSIVLLDFGAARQVENADVHKELTRSTQTILKHGFAPIEQYRSRGNLGPWTDVYALCATMYYCLTGKVPSEAPERVMGDDNVNWKQIPGLTEQQVAVLEKSMAIIPEKRVQSVKELYQALFGERRTTAMPVEPKKAEPEAVPAPPVEKPAETPVKEAPKPVGKKPVEYPTHTVALEEPAPAPRTKEPAAPAPVVMETKPKKKKKPVGIIVVAVLAVVAAAALFAMKPKETTKPVSPADNQIIAISAGSSDTAVLRSDGTVASIGRNHYDFSDWTDIVKIDFGADHAVGLKADGTVVSCGDNNYGQCDTAEWEDIVSISAGTYATVGLKADGTTVSCGMVALSDSYDRTKLERANINWSYIDAISADYVYVLGLNSVGSILYHKHILSTFNTDDWSDIVSISTGYLHAVGLRSNGTVVATGRRAESQCKVSSWSDITAVSTGYCHTVGLKEDGTVVATGDNQYGQCDVSDWTDIIAISAGDYFTVGLKSDGTLVATGQNNVGQCNVALLYLE